MGLFGSRKEPTASLPQVWPSAPNLRLSGLDSVGESHHTKAILDVLGEFPVFHGVAVLIPEPENSFDPNAIAVYVNAQRVGYLSRQSASSSRKSVIAAISRHGHAAVEVMILGGREHSQVVLQPGQLSPIARPRIAYALLRAGLKQKDGEKDWGFTIREEPNRSLVFCSGATSAQRDEFVPKYAQALNESGVRAQVVSDDGYPMVQVTG